MKSLNRLIVASFLCLNISCAVKTAIFQPGPEEGKDAIIRYYSGPDESNYGNHPFVNMHAWTNSGTKVLHRSLIEFDISQIPENIKVKKAVIRLYTFDPNEEFGNAWTDGCHRQDDGSNQSYLSRITSSWKEDAVNWRTQPLTTDVNKVLLPANTVDCEDYMVDVTALLTDQMSESSDALGVLIKLDQEDYYRRMLFASSDYPNPLKRPKLEVSYKKLLFRKKP